MFKRMLAGSFLRIDCSCQQINGEFMKNTPVVLAEQAGLGKIHLCDCSSVHVSVGPVTLNLAPEAFVQMATLFLKAAEEFSLIQAERETPEILFEMLDSSTNRLTH
jgi:hypothetical protein